MTNWLDNFPLRSWTIITNWCDLEALTYAWNSNASLKLWRELEVLMRAWKLWRMLEAPMRAWKLWRMLGSSDACLKLQCELEAPTRAWCSYASLEAQTRAWSSYVSLEALMPVCLTKLFNSKCQVTDWTSVKCENAEQTGDHDGNGVFQVI